MVKRGPLLATLGWVTAASLTTATATWAITLLGQGLSEPVVSPMSPDQISQALISATPTNGAGAPASPAESPAGVSRAFDTPGGSIVATCKDGVPSLVAWSPAQGYAIDDVEHEPGHPATVKFESENNKVTAKVTCVRGTPSITTDVERDD
ncbi:hypothetical protein [Sphaerisporangium aureirubrum]|uniref:Septum formation initiator n=1 Tax=Sphaerisporangium aureirubrum TaxID=1544736 RepID=A0ABW1NGB4_9ACTN